MDAHWVDGARRPLERKRSNTNTTLLCLNGCSWQITSAAPHHPPNSEGCNGLFIMKNTNEIMVKIGRFQLHIHVNTSHLIAECP